MLYIKVTSITELKELICSDKNRSGFYSKESTWKKEFPVFYKELNSWNFTEDFSFKQKIYHYLNNDLELKLGICAECGKRCKLINVKIGYHQFCSSKCSANSKETRGHYQQTCLEKYGHENVFQSEEIKDKIKETNINRYDCEYSSQNDIIKRKISTTLKNKTNCEKKEIQRKRKNTNFKKFGNENVFSFHSDEWNNIMILKYENENYNNRLKAKVTCLERYDCENPMQLEYVKGKVYQSKKNNNSFNRSKIEEQLSQYFIDNNINFIYQYRSEQYPFNCDLYFPEKDLYVEIQGHWTHGFKPFENTEDDRKKVECWKSKNTKFYDHAIETWTIRDVQKRETAKQNNLNWIEIFSCDFNKCISEILKLIN